jgi:hypothetical protein
VDLNVLPNRDTPMWSETRWNGCWNPDERVGLYTHMGRFRKDLDLWWAQTVAYLPHGELVVDRSWGRSTERERVKTGTFELAQREFGWTSSFDGVGQLSTTAELAAGVRGASSPSVVMRWEVEAEPAAPAWDMYGSEVEKQDFAGDTHIQQGFHTKGRLIVDGREYRLDGVGFKDHSSGVRTWDGFGYHSFTLAVMPDCVFHQVLITSTGGDPMPAMGMVTRGGEQSPLAAATFDSLEDVTGGPQVSELTIEAKDGFTSAMQVELLAALPITITEENDNINGIDWDAPGDPMVLIEGIGRFTDANGNVGYGMHERSRRRSSLQRPVSAGVGAGA